MIFGRQESLCTSDSPGTYASNWHFWALVEWDFAVLLAFRPGGQVGTGNGRHE
jgi:hypothetical protein